MMPRRLLFIIPTTGSGMACRATSTNRSSPQERLVDAVQDEGVEVERGREARERLAAHVALAHRLPGRLLDAHRAAQVAAGGHLDEEPGRTRAARRVVGPVDDRRPLGVLHRALELGRSRYGFADTAAPPSGTWGRSEWPGSHPLSPSA